MDARPLILAVDHNHQNLGLLVRFLERTGYGTWPASSLAELDQALDSLGDISLALVDLAGFDSRIWERCDRMRKARIPLLVIASRENVTVEQDRLVHGARDVLVKPVASRALLTLIRSMLEE